MNDIYETETFSKLYGASDYQEQAWIDKVRKQLLRNLHVGKPLRYVLFREKKFGNKRLFYLINEETNSAILVAFGGKSDQQKIIDHILLHKEQYLRLIS